MDKKSIEEICKECSCLDLKFFSNGGDAAIMPLMFTHAIVSGFTPWGYKDRWCYGSYEEARAALDAWDGVGEPDGWHRHPATGRRRKNGKEEVYL